MPCNYHSSKTTGMIEEIHFLKYSASYAEVETENTMECR